MQRIERYGVIALVFLLVTIVAVSMWGERKNADGILSFLRRDSKADKVEELLAAASKERASAQPEAAPRDGLGRGLPLSSHLSPELPRSYGGPSAPPEQYGNPLEAGPEEPFIELPIHESGGESGPILPKYPHRDVETLEDVVITPPVAVAAARDYTIRSGDTLSEISQRELGTKNRWRELMDANPGLDPARLMVGTRIRIPGGEARSAPEAVARRSEEVVQPVKKSTPVAGKRTYSVRSGDTLSQIAQRELGTQSRWRELVELNPGLDPARLLVGTRIVLPEGAAAPSTRVASATPATGAQSAQARTRSKVR